MLLYYTNINFIMLFYFVDHNQTRPRGLLDYRHQHIKRLWNIVLNQGSGGMHGTRIIQEHQDIRIKV